MSLLRSAARRAGNWYLRRSCEQEFVRQKPTDQNERPVEYRFAFEWLAKLCPRNVLDVGTGQSALPALVRTCGIRVVAIDNVVDYWPAGMVNRHWHVLNQDVRSPALAERFDVVLCISTLEHIPDHLEALRGMHRMLAEGGHILLTVPYKEDEYIENVYALPGSYGQGLPYVAQQFSRRQIEAWPGRVIHQEFWQFFDSPHWSVGNKIRPPRQVGRDELHQLTCVLIQKSQASAGQ